LCDKYGIKTVVDAWASKIGINTENVFEIRNVAQVIGDKRLLNNTRRFIEDHSSQVDLTRLSKEELIGILRRDVA